MPIRNAAPQGGDPLARSSSPQPQIPSPQLLRQRLAAGFGRERNYNKSHEKYGAHADARIAPRFMIVLEDMGDQQRAGEGTGCGYKTANVIAKRSARAAQMRGKQFGKIDRIAAK